MENVKMGASLSAMRPFSLDRTSGSALAEDTGTLQGLDQAVELVDHIGQRGAAGKRAHRGSGLNRTGGTGRAVYLCTTLDFPLC